jgi:predicted ATPase/DNA-binding SARP family transcriptional activator
VPPDTLIEAVWPEAAGAPSGAANALQSLVSRLRRAMADSSAVQQLPGGYRLAVDPRQVDAPRFLDLTAQGRRQLRNGDPEAAARLLRDALSLWRGCPLPDADGAEYVSAIDTRLTQARISAVCDLYDACVQLGTEHELVSQLEQVVAEEPLQEPVTGRLMSALVASGRTADALAAYQRLRTGLAQELGVDPDPQLQQQHLALLRGEPPVRIPVAVEPLSSGLRVPLTSFLGRDEELRQVRELLAAGRLVTIVGPGGAGKTRLSMEAAAGWPAGQGGPVHLVELAPVTAAGDIAQAVLTAVGVREASVMDRRPERRPRTSQDRLYEALQGSRALLVMDNCEHLLDGTAALVTDLLSRCPDLTVLATSREPLGVLGESLCGLSSLGLPAADDDAERALGSAAVELLRQRAAAVSGGFEVTPANVRDVAEIVLRLDGMPLAIELAAARVRVLPVAEIARRLGDRFRLLSGGNRAALPRHRSLHAVVEWSWDLLTESEKLLAERFSAFHGGATEAAVVAVCADALLPADDIPELLLALADKSLLRSVALPQLRYAMLETIREYGRQRLAERAEQHAADTAHARYFADLTQQLEPVLRSREQLTAFAVLREEQDNISAALRFLTATGDLDRAIAMVLARVWFWTMTEDHLEVVTWSDLVLDMPGALEHSWSVYLRAGRAMALLASGALQPDADGERSIDRFRPLVDELRDALPVQWPALEVLGPVLAFFSGDHERGQRWCEQLVQRDDPWIRGAVRVMRANFAENMGDTAAMWVDIDAALLDFESIGDRWGIATTLNSRAWLRSIDSDTAGALADFERAQQQLREMHANEDDLMLLLRLAALRLRLGDLQGARRDLAAASGPQAAGPHAAIRQLLADCITAQVELAAGDAAQALNTCRRLRRQLDAQTGAEWMLGHITAVVRSATAAVALQVGDLELARSDLEAGYQSAADTEDLPILASMGVSVAALAAELGQYRQATRILGAAARLRGGNDFTDPLIARTLQLVRAHWPEDEAAAYQQAKALPVADCIALLDPVALRLPVGAWSGADG